MKKLTTLVFAFVLASSMAFAQSNISNSTTSGHENSTTITQAGSNNSAETIQRGSENSATINQGIQGISTNNDIAFISQTGNGNDAEINQRGGWAGDQGTLDYSIFQEGHNNSATSTGWNSGNWGEIDQSGSENTAITRQSLGTGNSFMIDQNGSRNYTNLFQTRGDDNYFILNTNGSADNLAYAHQEGSANVMDLNFWSNGNGVDAAQYGESNELTLNLRGSGPNAGSGDAHTTDDHEGSDGGPGSHTVIVEQDGAANMIDASVFGNSNYLNLLQSGTDNMIGTGSVSLFEEGNHTGTEGLRVYGRDNSLWVTQNGTGNIMNAVIHGRGNTMTVTQQ